MLRERGGGEQRAGEAPAGCGVAREEQGRKSLLLVLRQSEEEEGEEPPELVSVCRREKRGKLGIFSVRSKLPRSVEQRGVFIGIKQGGRRRETTCLPRRRMARNKNPYRPCVRTAGMVGYNDQGGVPATADDAGHPRFTCQVPHLTLRGAMLRARSPEHGAGRFCRRDLIAKNEGELGAKMRGFKS